MGNSQLSGYFFDGTSSIRTPCDLTISSDGKISCIDIDLSSCHFSELRISKRVGNIPRQLYFPCGGCFETNDNDRVDQLIKLLNIEDKEHFIHRIESSLKLAALALITTILVSWGFIQFGIPALSKPLAETIPDEFANSLGEQTLDYIDNAFFEPSLLSKERQNALSEKFYEIVPTEEKEQFSLLFRQSPVLGANALALPSGHIIFTDEIIELADSDLELQTVMAHEIGHVIEKHTLRQLIQKSALAIAVVAITGDASTASSLVLAIPVLILETSYSRDFEREADQYALTYMDSNQIDRQYFADILQKLEQSFEDAEETGTGTSKDKEEDSNEKAAKKDGSAWQNYAASHPATEERINSILKRD